MYFYERDLANPQCRKFFILSFILKLLKNTINKHFNALYVYVLYFCSIINAQDLLFCQGCLTTVVWIVDHCGACCSRARHKLLTRTYITPTGPLFFTTASPCASQSQLGLWSSGAARIHLHTRAASSRRAAIRPGPRLRKTQMSVRMGKGYTEGKKAC